MAPAKPDGREDSITEMRNGISPKEAVADRSHNPATTVAGKRNRLAFVLLRYAHLGRDTVRVAAVRISDSIALDILPGYVPAKVSASETG